MVAIDKDVAGIEDLAGDSSVEIIKMDLETGRDPFDAPNPLAGREFAGIIVTNYLHRPLFPGLQQALKD